MPMRTFLNAAVRAARNAHGNGNDGFCVREIGQRRQQGRCVTEALNIADGDTVKTDLLCLVLDHLRCQFHFDTSGLTTRTVAVPAEGVAEDIRRLVIDLCVLSLFVKRPCVALTECIFKVVGNAAECFQPVHAGTVAQRGNAVGLCLLRREAVGRCTVLADTAEIVVDLCNGHLLAADIDRLRLGL